MKINPRANFVPFIVMVDPNERLSLEDFDLRKHDEYNYLAWDHNSNDYRQKMSSIEHIRFFHHDYLDVKQKYGAKLYPALPSLSSQSWDSGGRYSEVGWNPKVQVMVSVGLQGW